MSSKNRQIEVLDIFGNDTMTIVEVMVWAERCLSADGRRFSKLVEIDQFG